MREIRISCLPFLLMNSLALAACASSGGGGGSLASSAPGTTPIPVTNSVTPAPPLAGTAVPGGAGWYTGYSGPIAAPASASFGTSPPPAQLATPNGPTLDPYSSGLTPEMVFPVLSSTLQFSAAGLSVPTPGGNTSATATFTGTGIDSCDAYYDEFNLSLPAVAATAHVYPALSYVELGSWEFPNNSGRLPGVLPSVTYYVFGFESPAASVPANGQAAFSGSVQGRAFATVGGEIAVSNLGGKAAFSADFGSGSITGGFTGITAGNQPWNDVSLNASIAAGTNKFSGSTAVTSAPAGAFTLNPSATGHIDGGFYGPSAQQLGAVWSLSDGTASAIGGVIAGH